MKIALNPNSTARDIQSRLIRDIDREKYSFNFNGFAHGKRTLILIRDLSLPFLKPQSESGMADIYEFIRHYYKTCGWYLSDSDKHYTFKKLIFCATMNYHHPLPVSLTKSTNIINRPLSRQDLTTIVKTTVRSVCEAPYIGDMIVDLHYSILKEFSDATLVPLACEQAISIARGLVLLQKSAKQEIFRLWIYLS
jgi:hypothetical protein